MAQAIPNVPHPHSTRRPWPHVTGKQNSASVASGKAMSREKNVRGYGLKTIVVAVSLAVTIGIIGFRTVSAAPPQRAQVIQASATIGSSVQVAPKIPAPGTALYEAKRGDTVISVARHYLPQTSYLTSTELAEAMRTANSDLKGTFVKAGQQITVPGILDAPIAEKPVPVAKDFEVRAIYLTGLMAASDHGIRIVKHWRETGGNAVVFDIKDSDGTVNIPFNHPLIGAQQGLYSRPTQVHALPAFPKHARDCQNCDFPG